MARDALLTGDIYLLEGDVFFELDALRYLDMEEAENVAAVAPFDRSMEGSAVVLTENGYIAEVRMKQTAANLIDGSPRLFKTMNLIRFSGNDLRETIVPRLDDLIGSGAVNSYIEELLSDLVQKKALWIGAARCDDVRWYEIDNEDDLRIAEAMFLTAREIAC